MYFLLIIYECNMYNEVDFSHGIFFNYFYK